MTSHGFMDLLRVGGSEIYFVMGNENAYDMNRKGTP